MAYALSRVRAPSSLKRNDRETLTHSDESDLHPFIFAVQ